MSKRVVVINVVGLTQELLPHAPRLTRLGHSRAWQGVSPAVTMTAQATMLTGMLPREHGIVGNGWYFRDTGEIRFWQQSNRLIQGDKFYEGVETAKMFWWFNQGSGCRWWATPKPHYGSDGSKELTKHLGPFPFPAFWGPTAGLPSSEWIARATARVIEQNRPQLTLAYLPHLDYDFQRYRSPSMERVREVDECAGWVIDAAHAVDAEVVVVSEYGLTPVHRPVMINQELRRAGWLSVRSGPFGETLMPLESKAFAVADHQIAHVYVDGLPLADVQQRLEAIDGIDRVVRPAELGLDHPRAGELIALADSDAWFAYYYWLDDVNAPDFATSVDIHRKPGYDPCELFMTSKWRAALRLAQKKAGMRYRMDVVPLEPGWVQGSHGLEMEPERGPLIIGPDASTPDRMTDFKPYIRGLLGLEE